MRSSLSVDHRHDEDISPQRLRRGVELWFMMLRIAFPQDVDTIVLPSDMPAANSRRPIASLMSLILVRLAVRSLSCSCRRYLGPRFQHISNHVCSVLSSHSDETPLVRSLQVSQAFALDCPFPFHLAVSLAFLARAPQLCERINLDGRDSTLSGRETSKKIRVFGFAIKTSRRRRHTSTPLFRRTACTIPSADPLHFMAG